MSTRFLICVNPRSSGASRWGYRAWPGGSSLAMDFMVGRRKGGMASRMPETTS